MIGLDEEQEEKWLELLDRSECKTIPKTRKINKVILEIAQKEVLQAYIVDSWCKSMVAHWSRTVEFRGSSGSVCRAHPPTEN